MSWIAIKLFLGGWLKTIGSFLKENWRLVLGAVIIIVAYFAISGYLSNLKKEYYDKGVTAERTEWKDRIAKEDAANRKFEATLTSIIEKFGEKAVKESIERINRETIYVDKIKTIVSSDPKYNQCIIDNEVIEARNKIRAEGPTGVKSSRVSEAGTVVMEFEQ